MVETQVPHTILSPRFTPCDASVLSVIELVQELAEYLVVRYPSTFHIERHTEYGTCEEKFVTKGWGGASPIKSIANIPLGVTYELNEDAEDMMRVAALLSAFDSWIDLDSNAIILERKTT